MNETQRMLVENQIKGSYVESDLIIVEDEDVLVGEMSKETAEKLVGEILLVEFEYDMLQTKGELVDIYKSGATRIVIQCEDGQYEDRELHEVTYYEVL